MKKKLPSVIRGLLRSRGRLKTRLLHLFAMSLCVLAVAGIVLRSREGIAGLSWGWEDIVRPVTSELKHGRVNYGVYDSDQRFSKAKGVAIEHIFVSWLAADASQTIRSSFQYANERNRWLMVTVEPFAITGLESKLLKDVVAGTYDPNIASICRTIGGLQAPMFVSWGHEMEA